MTLTTIDTEERKKPGPKPKNANKNIRAPLGEETTVNQMSQSDKIRMATGKQARLDASFYARLPEYQGKQLFWENDIDGQVEKWLHLGAELVPRRSKSLKHFKGFTDRAESEWECVPTGGDGNGNQMLTYLLVMDAEDYQSLRIDPKNARNQEILDALGHGKSQTDQIMPNVKGLKTYAPNLPTGGRGFDQEHDV
jgi:hypothetical protein